MFVLHQEPYGMLALHHVFALLDSTDSIVKLAQLQDIGTKSWIHAFAPHQKLFGTPQLKHANVLKDYLALNVLPVLFQENGITQLINVFV